MRARDAVAAAIGLLLAGALSAPAASAAPGAGPTAAVSLGDSYISGEAGRWSGNSNTQLGDRDGTDRAWVRKWWGGYYDRDRVYLGGSAANGCHRSDVAPVRSAALAVDEKLNVACSGAQTADVFRAAAGGRSRNGEAPQADQLAVIARDKDVRLVVLSIGGNDLGFADIIAACAVKWTLSPSWAPDFCLDEQQPLVDARMAPTMAAVGKAIDEIRGVLGAAGYPAGHYRLVLQSYPSPVGRGAENRYPETGWSRLTTGGCPFWNRDLDWARGPLVNQIADGLAAVAAGRGVQFLDLRDLLDGREVCSKATSLATGSSPPSETRSEWVRFLVSGLGQGDLQESFHPNAYGQRALGRCLGLMAAQAGPAYTCRVAPGGTPDDVVLSASRTGKGRAARQPGAQVGPASRRAWPARFPSRRATGRTARPR